MNLFAFGAVDDALLKGSCDLAEQVTLNKDEMSISTSDLEERLSGAERLL